MNRDFILQVATSNIGNPVAILERHTTVSNQQALMVTLAPKFNLPHEKPETVFICGRSGSTAGESPDLQAALRLYLWSRGMYLGTFSGSLLSMSFGEQSRKWGDMAKTYERSHRRQPSTYGRHTPLRLSRRARPYQGMVRDSRGRGAALSERNGPGDAPDRRQAAQAVCTLNRLFNAAVQKARGHRIKELLRPESRKDTKQHREPQYILVGDIHDVLRGYYSLALDRFIDSIFQLAIDHCLLTDPSCPLAGFAQERVINLDPNNSSRLRARPRPPRHAARSSLRRSTNDLGLEDSQVLGQQWLHLTCGVSRPKSSQYFDGIWKRKKDKSNILAQVGDHDPINVTGFDCG
ncbi:hypothetical protein DL770_009680 [Monosporascus sp. CRB-9-2]|nr:hypothetical protein DL770_009680 [Monosporascus sp. CRB-9-2]